MNKRTKSGFLGIAIALVATSVLGGIFLHQNYYREYNSFRSALKAEGFEIERRWTYDEDFSLEDFGLYVVKGNLRFWIDVRFVSNIRTPDTRIEGILLQSLCETSDENERIIDFDSTFWRSQKLPKITTPIEFMAYADKIIPTILDHKELFPKGDHFYGTARYRNFLIIRDDDMNQAPLNSTRIENAD